MFVVIGVVAGKGGVGKTTIAANLGGLLADIGYRVLLIDADVQDSLSRYYQLSYVADHGLTRMVMSGTLTPHGISIAKLPPDGFRKKQAPFNVQGGVLHVVRSDTKGNELQTYLENRLDRLVRIRMAIHNTAISEKYDFVIIDTLGSIDYLQDAAVNASDLILTPTSPDILSARAFVTGTAMLIDRTEGGLNLGYPVPPMYALINRTERTTDSRAMATLIRDQFAALRTHVTVLNSVIPSLVVYRKAATSQVPAHWLDPDKAGDQMHALMWELLPQLRGKFAPNHRGEIDDSLLPPDAPETGPDGSAGKGEE